MESGASALQEALQMQVNVTQGHWIWSGIKQGEKIHIYLQLPFPSIPLLPESKRVCRRVQALALRIWAETHTIILFFSHSTSVYYLEKQWPWGRCGQVYVLFSSVRSESHPVCEQIRSSVHLVQIWIVSYLILALSLCWILFWVWDLLLLINHAFLEHFFPPPDVSCSFIVLFRAALSCVKDSKNHIIKDIVTMRWWCRW